MATKLGTAYVDVRPDFSGFWSKVAAELGGSNTQIKSAARAASKSIGDSLDIGGAVERDLRRGAKKIASAADESGQKIADGIIAGLNEAKKEVNAFARDGASSFATFGKGVDSDVTGSLQRAAQRINLFARDGQSSLGGLGRVARGVGADVTGSFDAETFRRVGADITGAIEHVGKSMRGFSAETTGAIEQASQHVNAFARDGQASFRAVGSSARKNSAEIKSFYDAITRTNISRALGDAGSVAKRAGADISAGTRAGTRGLRDLASAGGGAGGGLRSLGRDAGALGDAFDGPVAAIGGLRIALVLVVPALLAFGGAAIAATSALGPLVGLLGAGAGGALALVQGFGVLKLATLGISGAIKEQLDNQTKVGPAAAEAASQQRSAARAIQNAQDGVANATQRVGDAEHDLSEAQRDARKATKDLTTVRQQARRALQDMRTALRDSTLGEARALLDLKDAQQAVADLAKASGQDELADAARSVTDAIHGQRSAVLSLLEAQQSLDELMGRSAKTEAQRATAAAALSRAQENLARVEQDANATYADRTDALRLVADATTAVNDANRETVATDLDKARALQGVVDAQDAIANSQANTIAQQKALQELQAGATPRDQADALLSVAEAQQALAEAERTRARNQADLAAAERAGIKGSPDVIAAKEAIRQADLRVQGAERALKESHQDVVRAQQALSDAQISAQEQLAKTAAATANLNKKFDELPPAAQKFARALISLKPQFDTLRQTAAGGFFPGATAGILAAAKNFDSFNKVIGVTARALGDMAQKTGELIGSPAFGKDIELIGGRNAKVIETLGEALRHVISALRNVIVAAGPLTQWLADVIDKWALNASAAAKSGRETGKMAEFFEKTRAILERLGSIFGHVISGLLGVGEAGSKSGNKIWASIDRAAARFDTWANSVKGKKQLQDFFEETTKLAGELVKVMGAVTGAIAYFTLKLAPVSEALKLLGPYADEATLAFLGWKSAVYAHAAAMSAWGIATGIATGIAEGAYTAFWALNAALVASPIGLVVGLLIALGAALYLAWTKSQTFRDIVTGVWNAVKDAAVYAFGLVKKAAEYGMLGPIGLIITHWQDGKRILTGIWDGIKSAASTIWGAIKSVIINPIRDAADWVGDKIGKLAGWIKTGFDKMLGFAGDFATDFKNAIVDGFEGAVNLVIGFVNLIISALNEIPGVDIDKIDPLGKDKKKPVQPGKPGSNTQGVANKAEGGLVTEPIVIMGEEAPRFPEWVIPTNPAYRKRALMLLGQAANSIGYAQGGLYSKSDLKALWKRVNPGEGDANLMAAIALAESGGDAGIVNSIGAGGLWQIYPPETGYLNPETNARIAGRKLRGQGLGAWEAYTNDSYRKFLNSDNGGILDAIGGALGSLLSKGANWVLDQLPGVGSLPDWLKGAGTAVLGKAAKWAKDKVSDLIGLGGGDGAPGGGVVKAVRDAMALAQQMGLRITSTTGGEHVKGSYHYSGHAADVAGTPTQMAAFFKAALARYDGDLKELFYDPLGAIDNGHRIPAIGGHSDHVHIALARGGLTPYGGSFAAGGIVPGPLGAPVGILAHGGEAVTQDGAALIVALREHSAELRELRQSGVSTVMASIADYTSQRVGDLARQRARTASRGATAILGG